LIIASLAQPLRVQGDRNQNLTYHGVRVQILGQKLCKWRSHCFKLSVFELEYSLSHYSLKQEGGTYAVDGEWMAEACRAQIPFVNRGSAALAERKFYPGQ
jgi:hypothetical protein